MKEIIAPIDRSVLKKELAEKCRFVGRTGFGENELYTFTAHDAPSAMLEVGRLRELAFRKGGGGTGEPIDIDENDTNATPYSQLVVWDPRDEEITGGYRFIHCLDAILPSGEIALSTAHYFDFSERFKTEFLPKTIELGRSWVQPAYQPSATNRRGIFSLDNLWDGLGALVLAYPDCNYFFGKVTMYAHFQTEARDTLLAFMQHYFPDPDRLVWPHQPLQNSYNLKKLAQQWAGLPYKEGYRTMNARLRELGENVPPLINSYMNLSSTMRAFGTAVNPDFGGVEETGIMVTISEIYESKKHRHLVIHQ